MKTKILSLLAGTFFSVMMLNAATYTATTSGNWSSAATWGGTAPGTNILLDNIIIPSGITVTLDVNVSFNGLLSSLEVNGMLNSSGGGNSLLFTQGLLTGTGDVDIDRLTFEGLSTMTFSGDLTANYLESSSINLGIAGMATIEDTLFLDAGTVTLNTGGNLTMNAASNIVVNDGTLAVSGGLFTASNAYNVAYIGTSKNTGIEAFGSGLNDLTVMLDDSTETVTLTTDAHVHGTLQNQEGILSLNGNDLTISGNYTASGNSKLAGNIASSLILDMPTPPASDLEFTNTGSTLEDLEINIGGGGNVDLGSDLTINGELMLRHGDLTVGSANNLTMAAGSEIQLWAGQLMLSGGTFDGALAYDVTYYGASHTGTTIELSGAGLNDVTLDLDAETDSVSISYDIVVDGTLELTAGTLMLNGYDVEVIGGFTSEEEGWIAGDQNSDLTFTMALGSNDTVRFTDDHNMLNELNINIASGDNVNIVSDLHVEDVTLTSGGVTIYDNDLMINMSGSITGYNTDNYIRIDGTGSLLMNVDMSGPYVVFPVGTDSYSPANIQVTAGGSGMYFVNVKNEVYSEGVSGNNDALVESVVERTWRIIPTTANATANLQLEWTADAEVNGFDRTNSYISHYATDWDHVNSTAATTTGNTYQLTRSGETLLGSYAVMDEDATVSIEENDGVVFEVFPNPVTEKLNCIINIDEPVKLEVIDVNGSLVSVQAIQNTAGFPAQYSIDFSSYPAGTYFVRVTAGDRQVNHKVVKS